MVNSTSPPALILGCHKLGLGIIRSLACYRVPMIGIYYNSHDMGYVSKFLWRAMKSPHPDEEQAGFIDFIMHLPDELSGGVVIPSDDSSLVAVSKHKTELQKRFHVSAEDWITVRTCIEKQQTYQLADKIGVPCPRSYRPNSLDEAIGYAERLNYPCLLKPLIGHLYFELFRRKMTLIHNERELVTEYRTAENKNLKMMIQELIPGNETSGANYNSLSRNGSPVAIFTAQKVRLSPHDFGFPTVVMSKRIDKIIEPAQKLLAALGFTGFSCIEFKKDSRDGVYKLMEINPRQNLSSMLAVTCGINFAHLTYLQVLDKSAGRVDAQHRRKVYWIDMEKDLLEAMKNPRCVVKRPSTFLRPYVSKKVFAVLSLRDVRPVVKRIIDAIRSEL